MSAADRPGNPGGDDLSCPERDAMVASLLGITPERLRTIRRVHSKRTDSAVAAGGRAGWWQCIDQLGDDELFAAFRRREIRARRINRPGGASPIDRLPRGSLGRR